MAYMVTKKCTKCGDDYSVNANDHFVSGGLYRLYRINR